MDVADDAVRCGPEGADTGTPTDWHLQHLGSRAVAGAALVMVEATAVDPAGRSSVYDLGLWNDRQAESFRRIASFINAQGAVPGIQLVHAGRKAATGRPWPDDEREPDTWPTFGGSPVPFGGLPSPAELTATDVSAVVTGFADAAARAAAAGFRVLERHTHQRDSAVARHLCWSSVSGLRTEISPSDWFRHASRWLVRRGASAVSRSWCV
jgi:2,4-dienoyl-CoA reductase-like NADH-dependent reductase (Old Yellow Enzyme family)